MNECAVQWANYAAGRTPRPTFDRVSRAPHRDRIARRPRPPSLLNRVNFGGGQRNLSFPVNFSQYKNRKALLDLAAASASRLALTVPSVGRWARPPFEKRANSPYITSRPSFHPEDGPTDGRTAAGGGPRTTTHDGNACDTRAAAERSVNGANGRGREDGRRRGARVRNSIISPAVPVRPSRGLRRSLPRPPVRASASASTKECGLPTERRGAGRDGYGTEPCSGGGGMGRIEGENDNEHSSGFLCDCENRSFDSFLSIILQICVKLFCEKAAAATTRRRK